MNQKEICAHCGEFLPAEDGFYFEDQFFCPDCLEELTLLCHRRADLAKIQPWNRQHPFVRRLL